MSTLEIVDIHHLKCEEFTDLQRAAYAKHLEKLGATVDYMTPDFYRWKLNPPAGSAKIATVWEHGSMAAATAIFPVYLCLGDIRLRGWQYSDAATRPIHRKKGFFDLTNQALKEEIQPNEVGFSFPNHRSVHAFFKLGSINKGVITTWVNPMIFSTARPSSHISEVTRFSDEQDTLAERFAFCGKTLLFRSSEYLNWRYVQNPVYNYSLFVFRKDGEQKGFAVARTAQVMNQDLTLVMELWGLQPSVERALLRYAVRWAKMQRTKRIILLDNGLNLSSGILTGFLPVPSFLLPKKQVLLAFATSGEASKKILNSKWRAQTGDWDAF